MSFDFYRKSRTSVKTILLSSSFNSKVFKGPVYMEVGDPGEVS